jgi:hypothetical protein
MKMRYTELSRARRRALSRSFLCVFAVLVLALAGGLFFVTSSSAARGCRHHHHTCQGQGAGQQQGQQKQAVNCVLVVPTDPLSNQGLATPYLLAGAGAADAGDQQQCHENNPMQAAFVQAAALDPATGQISVYDPLVIDRGTQPAAAPVVPTLPAGAVVAIWVGFNGNNLTLVGTGGSLAAGNCVNGIPGSIFGQNSFCNATAFFQAANQALAAGKLKPPPLGTATDGQTCPSSRDFSLVDQDQSDNTTTQYLVTANGQLAQDEPQNRAQLAGVQTTFNGSDERVLSIALDAAIGCSPWTVSDLADTTHTQMLTAWPLNELQAAADQAPPVALIPALDPFTLVDGAPNLQKNNAYRAGVDQPQIASLADANTTTYCQNLLKTGLPRIALDQPLTQGAPSPFPNMANNLFTFLAMRFHNTFSAQAGFLHCTALLGVQNPVTLQMQDGIVVAATINLNPPPLGSGGPCPKTATAQGQDVMPGVCCMAQPSPGQAQVPCCLDGNPAVQDQSPTLPCPSPTPTDTTSTPTPTVSPGATPTEGTPQPTPQLSPTASPDATPGGSD